MSAWKDNNDNLEHIRKYIQKHERYFEALGFQRPGGLPRYYTEQRPEEWPLDLAKVERLKREEQAREPRPRPAATGRLHPACPRKPGNCSTESGPWLPRDSRPSR